MSDRGMAIAKRKRCFLWGALLALAAPGAAGAAGFDQFVGFGDSTMDSGYFRYNPTGGYPSAGLTSAQTTALLNWVVANGGSGAFAGPGQVDTTLLAAKFGLTAMPYIVGGGGGTNYANGAAQTVLTTLEDNYTSGIIDNVPTVAQISNYLASVNGVANPHALYMISTGPNDLLWLQTQTANTPSVSQAYMTTWATTLAAGVATLQADGARTIVELDIYDYARLVGPGGTLTAANAADVAQGEAYSAEIWSSLATAGVNFVPADVESLLKYVSENPTNFGFTPATVLASSPACGATPALMCIPANFVTPNAEQTYLFADSHHLTTAGQTIETDYIYSLLTAPSEISLLAESAVQGGLARVATIQGEIDLSEQHRGPTRVNVWASAGATGLSMKNAPDFPNASGVPFGGTVGTDYQLLNGVILGMAASAGDQTQNFSTGGHFEQVDQALSLYAAYRTGPLWGNAVASYGLLQNHIARSVPLGTFTDQDNGNTNGLALALALRGGRDFILGPVTTGPMAGLVLQHVHVDAFTETGTSGVTALSFGGQSRDSFVGQLGWRATMALGQWQPFAEIEWNHDWAGKNGTITATLTSIVAPSYSTAVAPTASDWASASLGTAYRFNQQVMLRGALSAEFINPKVSSFGGELGVNVSF